MRLSAAVLVLTALSVILSRSIAQDVSVPVERVHLASNPTLITVPIIVSRSGYPVVGLKKEDFALLQDGQEQVIAHFWEINTVAPSLPTKTTPRLQPLEFSNTGATAPTRLTIIALDTVSSNFFKQEQARAGLISYLQENITPREPIALVAVTRGGIRVLHDFTADPALLVAAVARAAKLAKPVMSSSPEPNSAEVDLADLLMTTDPEKSPNPTGGSRFVDPFAQMAYEGITFSNVDGIIALARAYANVPGRKSLIWISAMAPFAPLTSNGALRGASERALVELRNANMAVYPIDASGLSTARRTKEQNQAAAAASALGAATAPDFMELNRSASDTYKLERVQNSAGTPVDDMMWIADATGGRAIVRTNDVRGAITRAMDDSAHYYELAYYLRRNVSPGWHSIKVKVRQRGVRVRARSGVFVETNSNAPDPKADVAQALGSPWDLSGVPLTVRWVGVTGNDGEAKRATFELSIPPHGLKVDDRDGNRISFNLTVLVRQQNDNKTGRLEVPIERRLAPDKLQDFARNGFTLQSALTLPPGYYWVKFLVRDNITIQLGTITAPLKVE